METPATDSGEMWDQDRSGPSPAAAREGLKGSRVDYFTKRKNTVPAAVVAGTRAKLFSTPVTGVQVAGASPVDDCKVLPVADYDQARTY